MSVNLQRRASYRDLGYKEALGGGYRGGRGVVPGGGYYYSGWCRGVKEMLADPMRKKAAELLIATTVASGNNDYARALVGKGVITKAYLVRIVQRTESNQPWQHSKRGAGNVSLNEKNQFPFWMCGIALFCSAMLYVVWQYGPELLNLVK